MGQALGTAIGAYGGYQKWREGTKMQQEAEARIKNFRWNDLNNPYKDVKVSTMGADLAREEAARSTATAADALANSGSRGLGVAAGRLVAANNQVNREAAANLDAQKMSISKAIADQESKNQDTISERKASELAGWGSLMNVGLGLKYQGLGNMMNSAFAASSFYQDSAQKSTYPNMDKLNK